MKTSSLPLWLVVASVVGLSLWGGDRACPPGSLLGELAGLAAPASASAQSIVNAEAPGFTLKNLEGGEVSLADYEGKVVLIDFWATWCPPCRKGVPGLVELQEEFGERGLVIIGISLDDSTAPVKRFAEEYEINYPVVMGDRGVVAAYGDVSAIPTAFLVDREGMVVDRHVGFAPKQLLAGKIEPLL